jgi:hypothetical protein
LIWKASRWEEGARVRGRKERSEDGRHFIEHWAICLNSRELDLAAEEAIVGVTNGRELKPSEFSLRIVSSGR